MARLTSPTGVTVSVSDEKAAQLKAVGYSSIDEAPKKAPAKKSASSKSDK